MTQGFVKLNRKEGLELLELDSKAYLLLSQIALRARRKETEYLIIPLKANQAFIGDYKKIGLTRAQYRSAQERLTKYGLARFEPCRRGTIATLISTAVYDINAEEDTSGKQPSESSIEIVKKQPAQHQQIAIEEPISNQEATLEEPLTRTKEPRREECKKATADMPAAASLYECLRQEQSLSGEEKQSLMAYPEDRVKKSIAWSAQEEIKTTLIQALHWHCRLPVPPAPLEKTKAAQTLQQRAAWEYNHFLQQEGFSGLAEENQGIIPLGHIKIIQGGGTTSISLNNPIDMVRHDFRTSMETFRENMTRGTY